jgi:hypothetical protein
VIRGWQGAPGFAKAALVAALAGLAAAAPASAAVSGATTLALNGPAAESLRDAGIRIAPVKPARGGANRVVLPVGSGLAGAGTTVLAHRGGIALSTRGGVQLRLTKLRLTLGKRSWLSARLSGRDTDLFRVLGQPARGVDPVGGSLDLAGSGLKLTHVGAKALAARLNPVGERKPQHGGHDHGREPGSRGNAPLEVQPGRFGALSARATGLLAAGGESAPVGSSPAQLSTGCPLPSGAGPAPEEPLPVATRPPGAVDVTGATVQWQVRESFIRYIATGEGTSVSGGAIADPPTLLPGASAALSYGFRFPFAEGWHEAGANPADPADDSAAIEFDGALRFLYSDHGIDLTTAEPELEIAGGHSRAIFDVSESGGATSRQVLVNLDLGRAAKVETNGNAVTYERVPGAIPSGTATSVFGGFYAPGTEFGCFTVSYSTG